MPIFICDLFIPITRSHDLFITHFTNPVFQKVFTNNTFYCMTSLFTKRERSLIFSALQKTYFLKSMFLLNFSIKWYSNIFNLLNILMMLNKFIIQWFSINVTTRSQNNLNGKSIFQIYKLQTLFLNANNYISHRVNQKNSRWKSF